MRTVQEPVTLSEPKGLASRFFAEFILSEVEGLRMTFPSGKNDVMPHAHVKPARHLIARQAQRKCM